MVDAYLLKELHLAAAGGDIPESTFRRLMISGVIGLHDTVSTMKVDERLKRLEWIVGIATALLGILAAAVVNGLLSGRIVVTFTP